MNGFKLLVNLIIILFRQLWLVNHIISSFEALLIAAISSFEVIYRIANKELSFIESPTLGMYLANFMMTIVIHVLWHHFLRFSG